LVLKNRALKLIGQYRDDKLFDFLSEGLDHIFENVFLIETDAKQLAASEKFLGARILRLFAEEEAGKFVILLDIVRCKRSTVDFNRQLNYYYDHFAKRIYAWSCSSNQSNLSMVQESVEYFRLESYIHPGTGEFLENGNHIPDEREDALYSDCQNVDGELTWTSPSRLDDVYKELVLLESNAIALVGALYLAGFTSPASLRKIASRWRKIVFDDNYQRYNLEQDIDGTATDLKRAGLLSEDADNYLSIIQERWFFPLHGFELIKMKNPSTEDYHPWTKWE
jgi:AbiV family abortive infection protein